MYRKALNVVSFALCLTVSTPRQARFLQQGWADFQNLSEYMTEILLKLIELHSEGPERKAAEYARTETTAIAFFILAVIACDLAFYPTVTRRLNQSIKGTRALLLLLPEDVVTSVPTLKETMLTITKRLSV